MGLLPPDAIRYQLEHVNENKAPGVFASVIICFTFACIAVLLRLISRRVHKAGLGLDDYMIVAALVDKFATLPLIFSLHSSVAKYFNVLG